MYVCRNYVGVRCLATDFNNVEMKAGLEVHQQLEGGKLFCNCPYIQMSEDQVNLRFERKLRSVLSELGKYDPAAIEAAKKKLSFEYYSFNACNCLIENDEEPIQPANPKALKTIYLITEMLQAKLFDELTVMRKTVIDGSNTSGFQRTILVATGGKLKISGKEVGIDSIALEEDSARPVKRTENKAIYNLDRLGVPLIEMATAPDLKSPAEVKECALKIGELLRRTCRVRRGLGTIRQDINISIPEGARIELKGVQQIEMADEITRREIQRQQNLVDIRKMLKERNITEASLESKGIDVTALFKKTNCKFLDRGLQEKKKVTALVLRGFAGILGKEIQPEKRFGKEVSEYVKVKTKAGIIHSDELPAYGITQQEIDAVGEKLGMQKEDAFVLVCAATEVAEEALIVVIKRAQQAILGVPEETREVEENGNSKYLRPLPGSARMYPETDAETITPDPKMLQDIKKQIPRTVEERLAVYKKHGLSNKLAEQMKLSKYAVFYEELLKKKSDPTTAAVLLLDSLKQLERAGLDLNLISNEMIETVLEGRQKGKITQDILLDVLRAWAQKPREPFEDIITGIGAGATSDSEALGIVQKIVSDNKELVKEKGDRAVQALMGDVMKQLKGKIDGKKATQLLKQEIQKATE
jgi:glutamyl-tRNA(Gln) amidotransferase subunit E